jgi:alkylation response protein AidB-like acyl-CoA dehydrogenase
MMTGTETEELPAFRQEVRNFIQDNLPDDIRETVRAGRLGSSTDTIRWQQILQVKGWVAPNWPVELGGVNWTPMQRNIFEEECALGDCPPLDPMGLSMIGPLIIAHGTQAQKDFYLPKILKSEERWCQGYSEPGSGSDLASLQTRAVRDGDEYVVNGTKIWTSGAQSANRIFCLVRTDPDAKPQQGISLILIDLKSPGITIRPIIGLNEMHFFNQIFFDDVRVPVANRVGEENAGWTLAKEVLGSERMHLSRTGENKQLLKRLMHIAAHEDSAGGKLIDEDWFRRRIGQAEVNLKALDYTKLRFLERAQAGEKIGPEISMLKLLGSELIQEIDELMMEAVGHYGLPYDPNWMLSPRNEPSIGSDYAGTLSANRFRHKGYTIAGGSSEVQRTILAKHVLGM